MLIVIVFKHLPQEVCEHLSILSKIAHGNVLSDKLVSYLRHWAHGLYEWVHGYVCGL